MVRVRYRVRVKVPIELTLVTGRFDLFAELSRSPIFVDRCKMATYQQYGHMRGYTTGENGFQFSQTAAALGPTKQAAFSFRKRFERIDWKRLGKFRLSVCICPFMSVFACGVCLSAVELYVPELLCTGCV